MNVFQPNIAIPLSVSPIERRTGQVLIVLLVALVGVYVYFTGAMILHAVSSQEADRTSQDVASKIAAHEMQYLALVNSLTIERANEIGLTAVMDKHFVTRATRLGANR